MWASTSSSTVRPYEPGRPTYRLAAHAHLVEEYQRYRRTRPTHLTAAELAAIRALAEDIPTLWAAPTTTAADRKKLIREVIERVEVRAQGDTEKVRATIVWAGGTRTGADLVRPVARVDQLSYYSALVERITALTRQGLTSAAISAALAAEGLRPPRLGERFNPGEIQHLIRRLSIRRLSIRHGRDADRRTADGELAQNEWWLAALAAEIGIPVPTLFNWLQRGWVHGRQDTRPPYRWIITAGTAELERLRALHHLPTGYHNRRRWTQDLPEHPIDHPGEQES